MYISNDIKFFLNTVWDNNDFINIKKLIRLQKDINSYETHISNDIKFFDTNCIIIIL